MCFFSGLLFLWLLSTSRSCDCSNLTSVVVRPILSSKAVGDSKASLTFAVDVNQTCDHHEQGKITVVDVIHPSKTLCRFLRKDGTCQPVYDSSREDCSCHTENNTYTVRGSGSGWEMTVELCNGEKHPFLLREPQVRNLTISIQSKTATSSSLSLDNTTTAPPATLNSTPTRPASTLNNTHTSLASTLTPTPSAAADVAAPATAADAASVAEVSITCSWVEGEPAESWGKAQLSKDGTVLPATETTTEASTSGPPRVRHLHYVIKHARCEDSGRVECRVPGTEVSLTRNLLVGCGPPFDGTEREPSTWTSSDVPETSTSTEMDQGGPPFDGTEREPSTWTSSDVPETSTSTEMDQEREPSTWTSSDVPETSTSTEMDQATDEPPAQKSVGQLHLFVTAGVSTLCFVALFVVIALLCHLKSSLKGMKQRYLARSQSRRHRQRQPVPSVLPNVCYRASTNSLMINTDLYGRSEVNDRLDAFGYSEVRDSYARHNPDTPGGHLPLAELPRLRQQDSKLRLKVRDDDLYQGSTLTGRIDRYGYSDLRGVAKRHAAAADDDVLGAVGGAHLSFEEPEKEEENLYAEIKDVSGEQTRGEDLPSSALCPNPGEAELTEPYVPVDRIKKRKKEHRKYRKAADGKSQPEQEGLHEQPGSN